MGNAASQVSSRQPRLPDQAYGSLGFGRGSGIGFGCGHPRSFRISLPLTINATGATMKFGVQRRLGIGALDSFDLPVNADGTESGASRKLRRTGDFPPGLEC